MGSRSTGVRPIPRPVTSAGRTAATVTYEEANSCCSCERHERECAVDRPSSPCAPARLLDQCFEIRRRSRRRWAWRRC